MMTALCCLALAFAIGAISTPWIRQLSIRRGWLDATGGRKIHVRPTPRLGGVAIIFSFYLALGCTLVWLLHSGASPRPDRPGSVWVLVGGLVIALLGIYDDVRGADARTKFFVQFAVATALYATGFHIERITTPMGAFTMGPLAFPFTLIWIVGVTNAVNLIDGLDGLAGGVAFIALSALFAISAIRHETFMMLVSAALAGSVLGFLVYNFNPASIFMGDSGSMFLGFMIATSSIRASQTASTAVAILLPIVLLAIPIADTSLAVVRRAIRRRGIFTGDREHIHHRLLDSGLSHREAVVALYAVSVTCGLSAVTLYVAHDDVAVLATCTTLVLSTWVLIRRVRRPATAAPVVPGMDLPGGNDSSTVSPSSVRLARRRDAAPLGDRLARIKAPAPARRHL